MVDQDIRIYSEKGASFSGKIKNDCLSLTSEVWGAYNSEQHIEFSKEQTEKLFSLISLEDFLKICREKKVSGMWEFLDANDIHPTAITI